MSASDDIDRNRRARRRLGHDTAGHAYTASPISPSVSPQARPREIVSSRSTDAEAQDLLALRRARRGDDGAFAELLSANDVSVRALISALTGPDNVDILCTQVYLRAYRGLPVAPVTSPRLWLLGIADGAARDVLRRRVRPNLRSGDGEPSPIPSDLAPEQRLVLAAIHGVGLTPRETARLTTSGVDIVRQIIAESHDNASVTLPLPPPGKHGPRFWDDLGRRLLVERSAPAVAARADEKPIVTQQTSPTSVQRGTNSGRAAKGMAMRVAQQHAKVFPWRAVLTATAVTVVVLMLVGITFVFARNASDHDAGLGETATKVLNRLDSALADDAVIRGSVTITSKDPATLQPGSYRFVRANTGSWQVTSTTSSMAQGYDVPSATMVMVDPGQGPERAQVDVRTGLAPGPPEPTAVARHSLGDLLGESVRMVRTGVNGTVTTRSAPSTSEAPTPTISDGPQQWVVDVELTDATTRGSSPLAGTGALSTLSVDQATLVADQSFALPTKLTLRRNGGVVATLRFGDLSISQQPLVGSYAPEVPDGAEVTRSDHGFVPTEIGRLNTGGDGTVPTPSYLPQGFVITAVAVNPTDDTTVLCYRSGSRQLVLTVYPKAPKGSAATDPFSASQHNDNLTDEVRISSGIFAGRTGSSALNPIAHVWVTGSSGEVVAAGDPTIEELIKVVASLR